VIWLGRIRMSIGSSVVSTGTNGSGTLAVPAGLGWFLL